MNINCGAINSNSSCEGEKEMEDWNRSNNRKSWNNTISEARYKGDNREMGSERT